MNYNIIQLNNKNTSNIIINKQTNKQIHFPVQISMNYRVLTNRHKTNIQQENSQITTIQ